MTDRSMLIVGGGFAGMALAVFMRRQGWTVDLVEADPDWRVYGAGITITGSTFRAFDKLGLVDEIARAGYSSDYDAVICDAAGTKIHEIHSAPLGPGLPVTGGIMRPVLHGILADLTRASGAQVRLGATVETFDQTHDERVDVVFSDGAKASYDLVVGADGVFSTVRSMIFPDAPAPRYTGQYCWRVLLDRPDELDKPHFFMAGRVTAGLVPVSPSQMYMWLLEPAAEKARVADDRLHVRLTEIMAPYGGLLAEVREGLGPLSPINSRPLDAIILPKPWARGRVVLIGDAAHATTPHLASGAGLATEDALVLSETLQTIDDIPAALDAFTERRWERCRLVVENSVEIGRMQQTDASPDKLNALMGQSIAALRAPI